MRSSIPILLIDWCNTKQVKSTNEEVFLPYFLQNVQKRVCRIKQDLGISKFHKIDAFKKTECWLLSKTIQNFISKRRKKNMSDESESNEIYLIKLVMIFRLTDAYR